LERQALADELGAKDAVIAELERKVAQLVTSAEVKREQANPVIAQLERKVAQLVTAAEVKSEKENQVGALRVRTELVKHGGSSFFSTRTNSLPERLIW